MLVFLHIFEFFFKHLCTLEKYKKKHIPHNYHTFSEEAMRIFTLQERVGARLVMVRRGSRRLGAPGGRTSPATSRRGSCPSSVSSTVFSNWAFKYEWEYSQEKCLPLLIIIDERLFRTLFQQPETLFNNI